MRSFKTAALLIGAVIAVAVSSTAFADRYGRHGHRHHHHHGGSRVHFGVVLGAPLWYPPPFWAPAPVYPAYPYPPAVIIESQPRVYIERDEQAAAQQRSSGYWYYCREADAYYPYVKQCQGPWERVPARPQAP